MNETQICPICGRAYDGKPALSRTDNQTLICPDCGTRHALSAIGVVDQEAVIARIHEYEAYRAKKEKSENGDV